MKTLGSVTITAVAAAILAFSAPLPAYSQAGDAAMAKGHNPEHGYMMNMDHMDHMGNMPGMCIEHADKIGLTDEQLAKMKPAHREMQKKQARFKADLKIAEIDLIEIMEVRDFNLEKATTAVRKIAEIKTAYHLEMLKTMKEMRALFTDEQFQKMKKMMPMKQAGKKPAKRMMKRQP